MNTCGGNGTRNKTIVLRGTLKLKQQTNADRLRAMSDEELAEWLRDFGDCDGLNRRCKGFGKCKECWLDWLRQEANDG